MKKIIIYHLFTAGSKNADNLTNLIVSMIVKDLLPLSFVEKDGFKDLIHFLAPEYKLLSAKTITKLVENKFILYSRRLKTELDKYSSFGLTCDAWTDVTSKGFLGVTIHLLSKESKMENAMLGLLELKESHTSQFLQEELLKLLTEFEVPVSKISNVVSDGAANFKHLLTTMFGEDKWIWCFAHQLNIVVQKALSTNEEIKSLISTVRSIVKHIRNSSNARLKLKKGQQNMSIAEKDCKELILDCKTRWNSTLTMISRYIDLEIYVYPSLKECKSEKANSLVMPSSTQVATLRNMMNLLSSVEYASLQMSGDSYATCSLIIPVLQILEDEIMELKPTTSLGRTFKENFRAEFFCKKGIQNNFDVLDSYGS